MSLRALYMVLPDQTSAATFGSSTAPEIPPSAIAEGNHAAVCAELAAHIRREAMWSEIPGAMRRLWQLADIVDASAWLPAGDYLWTLQLSAVVEVSCRVSELRVPMEDLARVAC